MLTASLTSPPILQWKDVLKVVSVVEHVTFACIKSIPSVCNLSTSVLAAAGLVEARRIKLVLV